MLHASALKILEDPLRFALRNTRPRVLHIVLEAVCARLTPLLFLEEEERLQEKSRQITTKLNHQDPLLST